MSIGGFEPQVAFYLDGLSVVMTCVIGLVSFLILLYSIHFMTGDDGYSRFFCYMSLFVGSMLTLVLADNLLLLYLGWEGVGLCSYLLIGFWYRDPANGRAAIKAFVVTRIGDAALLVGIILLATGSARCRYRNWRRAPGPNGRSVRRWPSRRRRCWWAARWGSRRSCRFTRGCPMRWPVPRRSAH